MVRSRYDTVLLIPESAILRDGKSSYVFVNSNRGEETGTATRIDVTIIGQTGSFGVVDASAGQDLEIIILGQAAVADETPIRIRRQHQTPPQTIFD